MSAAARETVGDAPVTVVPIESTPACCVLTARSAGDMGPAGGMHRWGGIAPLPWSWVRQVHGAAVVAEPVSRAADSLPPEGDGMVAAGSDVRLAMFAADCALVAVASPEAIIGIAHCGWRGLASGVLEAVAEQMRLAGASSLRALRGPCIGPECYEFGEAELELVERRYGPAVRSLTRNGALSLDMPAAVRMAAAAAGLTHLDEVASCTACDERWFSFRARKDEARHAMIVAVPLAEAPPSSRPGWP